MFVSLDNIWNNENAPKRTFFNKVKLTAKNGLNNLGVAKKKIFSPFKPLSLEDKRGIIKDTNSSLEYLKDLGTKPTETIARSGANIVKETIEAPVQNSIAKGIGSIGAITTGNPLAYSPAAEIIAKETINGVPVLKNTIGAVDNVVGSKKLANKINPEAIGKAASVVDNTAKSGIKTGLGFVKKIFRR